jgi:RHS repeat-associated protein
MQYYRASSRKDVADNINYHTENFSYSNNNFTGYPSNKGADSLDASFVYSAAIALENNNKYTHTFNNKQLEIKTELSNNNALKMESNYVYDNKNQLSSVEQKIFGVAIQNTIEFFEFDDKGDLAAYWDKQAGSKNDTEHKRSFTYDSRYALRLVETYKKDNVTIITDSNTLTMDGKSVSNNKFYTNNILTGQTDYTFDSYGNVLTKTSYASASKSIVTTFTYSGGVHLLSESRGGITLNYTYDIMGRRLTSKDGNHYQISYAYDGIGRVTQITNPDNSTVQNGCDDTALTMTSQNEIGLKIKTIYGKLGIVKQIQDVTQTSVILETNTYDAFLRLSSHTDARGLVTAYSYDYLDRVLTKTTGGAAYQEIYNYDDALTASSSRVTKTIQGETNAPSITTVTYTNLYGFVEKDGGVIDNVEQLTTFTYDYLGDQLASTTPDHITASFQYDGSNRLIKTTNPDGSVYQQAFDWIGRKTSSTDPKNAVSLFTYDDADRLTQEEIPFDESYYSVKNYFYDSNSNITSQRQSNNKPGASATKSRIDYQYNNRNYLIKVSNYDSNAIENYVTYTYDAVGNKLTMSAANETQTTSYLYDKRSRLIKYTDPMGGFETYIYDNNNNLLTKTDRMNTVVTNDYDALNRLYSITARKSNGSVADEYMMYQYYKTGAKKQEKNESLTTEFVYDSAGRVIQQTETTNAVTTPLLPNAAIIKTFGYDVRGNRISLGVSRNGITDFSETYEYDSMNRLMKVYDNDRLQATYSYDLNGNRQTLSCGGMFAALTSYNTTAYNLNKIRTYGSGIVTRYAYNSANLVTSLTNSRGNQVISSYQYTYKLDGNQDSKIDSFGVSTVYTYDDLGRLTNETETMPAGAANTTAFTVTSKSYTFDSANNRQSMIVNTEVTPQGGSPVIDDYTLSYNYNKRNQLLSETLLRSGNKDAVTSYLYDLNGNCTLKVSQTPINGNNNTVMTSSTYNTLAYNLNNKTEHSIKKWEIQSQSKYFYDVFNRMIEVERGSSSSAYRYKADGLRVSISVSQSGQVQTEFHVWDGSNIIALLDGAGGLLKRYIRGIGLIKNVIIANDAEEYFIFNAHGDVVQLTNADGVVIRYYYYSAFGVELKQDPNDTNVWRYCEEYWDIGSNAYYLRARYYDPASSRMLSEDNVRYVTRNMPNGQTIIEPLSLNLCTYCANNPVMYVDPTGHEWYHWAIAAGFVVAAGAALIITAGGATPAVIALASVANGMAAATTASTLAAGAFIGSSMAFAGTLMLADTSSVNAFKTSGNWGTVSVTAFGGAFGTAMGGFMSLMNRNPASSDDTMMLFRGDKLAPDKVFKNGFIPKGIDNDFDAYYAHLGGVQGNFISSSSDVEVAKLYAGTNGYIYVYTTSNYIDTNAFLRTYSQYPLDIEFTHCGAINASDIVGAFAVKNGEIVTDFIANLNYRGYSAPNLPSGWLPPLPPGRR